MRCGGSTVGSLSGLLSLKVKHPDAHIFRTENIEEHYDVEKEPIARGKFASVRLARHRTTGQVFAAKFLRRRRRAANLEEAQHEIAVLLLGRSTPYIVHLHQVFETKSEYIIILEFGEGGDLQKLLDDKGRLPETTVQGLLCQVLKGLEYLHQKSVAHLDIKPQNLVLMDAVTQDRIKLVDFGLSRVIHKDAELTQIMGTPDYVAPEVINFEPVGLATDMWSIGVLAYVLLSGYTPFGGDSDQETFVNITHGDFDFPDEYFDDISDDAKDFITSLLVKSTKKRMTVAECETHPWLHHLFYPHEISQLSEVDSVYSADPRSGSHSFSRCRFPSDFDLCQISIPEHHQVSSHNSLYSYRKHELPHQIGRHRDETMEKSKGSERRPKLSSAHLSMNVAECLQPQRPLSRPFRRSSLVIPKSENEYDTPVAFQEPNSQFKVGLHHEKADRNLNSFNRSNHFDSSLPSNLNTFNRSQLASAKELASRNQFDPNSSLNTSKPSNNSRYGSYSRALDQLKSLPRKSKPQTNLGLRPELSCSMFELKANNENTSTHFDYKPSNFELKKSMFDLRSSRKDLKGGGLDITSSRPELQNHNNDVRGSLFYLKGENADRKHSVSNIKGSKHNLRNSKYDLHGSRNDLQNSESELRLYNKIEPKAVKSNLLSSHNNLSSIPYLNMSLSRLDIAHETLDNEESEKRDVVYGDYTLPHRFRRTTSTNSQLLGANSFHISFRRPKKRDNKF